MVHVCVCVCVTVCVCMCMCMCMCVCLCHQVLSEAVEADEPLVPVEAMDEGGRLLLEELIERQVRACRVK